MDTETVSSDVQPFCLGVSVEGWNVGILPAGSKAMHHKDISPTHARNTLCKPGTTMRKGTGEHLFTSLK